VLSWICLIFLLLPISKSSAQTNLYDYQIMPDSNTISWNILFGPGSTSSSRSHRIDHIAAYITNAVKQYNNLNGTNFQPRFNVYCCPCDTLLCNFNFLILNGSGGSLNPPPKPPGGGGSGDLIAKNNSLAYNMPDPNAFVDSGIAVINLSKPLNRNKIIGIMDTGLDPSWFNPNMGKLIWQDIPGQPAIANFLPNAPDISNGFDDYSGKHGTAVTALVLSYLAKANSYPRIMVLKVLDSQKRGTTFSVSCALSYSIQKHVTLVNASLGYYGKPDPILKSYVAKAKEITILAAAGNTPDPHNGDLCARGTINHLRYPGKLFYPACFSKGSSNVIAVTTVRSLYSDCAFQNYSSVYVSIGVLNNSSSCCKYSVPFLQADYEGTSFATPVITGMMMTQMINSPSQSRLGFSATNPGLSKITNKGTYVRLNP
jgi:hypothetical protein